MQLVKENGSVPTKIIGSKVPGAATPLTDTIHKCVKVKSGKTCWLRFSSSLPNVFSQLYWILVHIWNLWKYRGLLPNLMFFWMLVMNLCFLYIPFVYRIKGLIIMTNKMSITLKIWPFFARRSFQMLTMALQTSKYLCYHTIITLLINPFWGRIIHLFSVWQFTTGK